MKTAYWTLLIPAGALVLALAGCEYDNSAIGPMNDYPVSVDLNNATRANVNLNMAAGELNIRGGTPKLVEGHIEYNVAKWKPEVLTQTGQVATVTIKQPESGHVGGNTRYTWNLELNDTVPLMLELNCGAGQAKLNLGDLNLENVNVHMGAGEVDLDLQGHPTHSYRVDIAGGVGQATVRLPHGVGVRAEAHGGLGSIEVHGLTKHDNYYSNDSYGNTGVNIELKVEGGIGQIQIFG